MEVSPEEKELNDITTWVEFSTLMLEARLTVGGELMVGATDGKLEGIKNEGTKVGTRDIVGDRDGMEVGRCVIVGNRVGKAVGDVVGDQEGRAESVGENVGLRLGSTVGTDVGSKAGVGLGVG